MTARSFCTKIDDEIFWAFLRLLHSFINLSLTTLLCSNADRLNLFKRTMAPTWPFFHSLATCNCTAPSCVVIGLPFCATGLDLKEKANMFSKGVFISSAFWASSKSYNFSAIICSFSNSVSFSFSSACLLSILKGCPP